MKLWCRDLLGDQAAEGWSTEEFGAHVKLLCIAWQRGGIPADGKTRARLLGLSPQRETAIWGAIAHYWQLSTQDTLLVNPEQEQERAEAEARSKAAKRSAEARWGRRKPGRASDENA